MSMEKYFIVQRRITKKIRKGKIEKIDLIFPKLKTEKDEYVIIGEE